MIFIFANLFSLVLANAFLSPLSNLNRELKYSSSGFPGVSDNDGKRDGLITVLPELEFDLASGWNDEDSGEDSGFWNKILRNGNKQESAASNETEAHVKPVEDSLNSKFEAMAQNLRSVLGGISTKQTIRDIVAGLRENTEQDVDQETSFSEIINMVKAHGNDIRNAILGFLGDLDMSSLAPTSFLYYLEYEDERKNPSWKRRIHRFCRRIDLKCLEELNHMLHLAQLCYADNLEQVREGLENLTEPYELVFVNLTSAPGAPANFVAVKRDQAPSAPVLEVAMGVRGTKSVADVITDLVCESADYRGGKSHSFMLNSGMYLVEKHTELLKKLLQSSGKSVLKLNICGHSLGAGAAAIAGIEFYERHNFDVAVYGFGSPAMLSRELAEKYKFIKTIVNDADVVPRLSGPTVANLLINVMQFNWLQYAHRDIEHVLDELESRQPTIFSKNITQKAVEMLTPLLESYFESTMLKEMLSLNEPELFPPGDCIHFFHDGDRITGTIVPNDFFKEIDVTRRMVRDHLFDEGYQKTFLNVIRDEMGDHSYQFRDSLPFVSQIA